jgi:hypothetical protein
MITSPSFLYKKLVDKSTLFQGISIPVKYQPLFLKLSGGMLVHGESMMIKILIDGELYDAEWINQGFNKNKYAGHSDVMQFRYSEKSPIVQKLRQIFQTTYTFVQGALNNPNRPKKQIIRIPEELQEYIIISATSQPDVFAFDCVTNADQVEVLKEIETISEESFEEWIGPKQDKTSGYTYSSSLRKVRKLDHSIGESLKRLYDYRCQVTGEKVGDQYAVEVVEAHHINPFTISMNNDTDNIIILSPSFHRIVHKAKPVFDYNKLSFVFPNGVIEKVKLNKHLGGVL